MPVSLAQLAGNRATLTIPLDESGADANDGPALHLVYRPAAITPRSLRAMRGLEGRDYDALTPDEQMAALDTITGYLASLVIEWDLTDSDGHPIAPTRAGLEDVDYETQGWLLSKIHAAQTLGKATGTPPSAPSS